MDKYFVKSEDDFETFATLKEQSDYTDQLIEGYRIIGEEWPEEVEDIICGVITARTKQIDLKIRPDNLDEGYDKNGMYWPDNMDSICDYEMTEI